MSAASDAFDAALARLTALKEVTGLGEPDSSERKAIDAAWAKALAEFVVAAQAWTEEKS